MAVANHKEKEYSCWRRDQELEEEIDILLSEGVFDHYLHLSGLYIGWREAQGRCNNNTSWALFHPKDLEIKKKKFVPLTISIISNSFVCLDRAFSCEQENLKWWELKVIFFYILLHTSISSQRDSVHSSLSLPPLYIARERESVCVCVCVWRLLMYLHTVECSSLLRIAHIVTNPYQASPTGVLARGQPEHILF